MENNKIQSGKSSAITRMQDNTIDNATGLFAAQASRALELPQTTPNPQAEKIPGDHFWKILEKRAKKGDIIDFGTVALFDGNNTDIAFFVLPDGTHEIKAIYSAATFGQEDLKRVVAVAQSCPKWDTSDYPSAMKKMAEYLQSCNIQTLPSKEEE